MSRETDQEQQQMQRKNMVQRVMFGWCGKSLLYVVQSAQTALYLWCKNLFVLGAECLRDKKHICAVCWLLAYSFIEGFKPARFWCSSQCLWLNLRGSSDRASARCRTTPWKLAFVALSRLSFKKSDKVDLMNVFFSISPRSLRSPPTVDSRVINVLAAVIVCYVEEKSTVQRAFSCYAIASP